MLPSAHFLRNMGKASIVAGIVLIGLAEIAKRV